MWDTGAKISNHIASGWSNLVTMVSIKKELLEEGWGFPGDSADKNPLAI